MTETVFLFAYFTGKGEEGMRLATSDDGLRWIDLPGCEFLIAPDADLMRDPFLYFGKDETFHLIWTTHWDRLDIGYAHSKDLRTWSPQRRLPLMQGIKGARNCWAPEMVFDDDTREFILFWSSTVTGLFPETAGSSENDYNHRIWFSRTKDFRNFKEAKPLFDPGFNLIDATFVKDSLGKLRLVAKNETLEPVAKNLFHIEADSWTGPFSQASQPFTGSWVEGPACLTLNGYTYVYFDQYLEKCYGAVRTKDFANWENVSDQVEFPQGARHGSILEVPRAVIKNLA